MQITEKENYKILKDEKGDLAQFADELTKEHSNLKEYNLVIDLLEHKNINAEQLLMFLEISAVQLSHKRSFVIVKDNIEIDKVPEDLIIAPTLREAEDVINMDELQRELGL
ncbi:MAG: ribonuclease Z [Bacteroidota bacterium]